MACSATRKPERLEAKASMTGGALDIKKASFILDSRSEKAPLPLPDTRDARASPGMHAGSFARRASFESSDCKRSIAQHSTAWREGGYEAIRPGSF